MGAMACKLRQMRQFLALGTVIIQKLALAPFQTSWAFLRTSACLQDILEKIAISFILFPSFVYLGFHENCDIKFINKREAIKILF